MQVTVSESRLLGDQRGLTPRERAISARWGWRDGIRINFEDAWLLRQADNMGQRLQRHQDPKATSVSVEKKAVNILLLAVCIKCVFVCVCVCRWSSHHLPSLHYLSRDSLIWNLEKRIAYLKKKKP